MGIIRLLLAIAVLNSHFPFLEMPMVDGHEAVLAFFAISGFYMALVLDTPYASPGSFYMGRFLSLYPIYLFALIFSVALLVTWDIHPMTNLDKVQTLLSDPISLLVMLWTSACILGQELLFSLAQSPDGQLHVVETSRYAIWRHAPLIQAWSLSLEIMFYALAPFLVRMKSKTLIVLIAVSVVAKATIMVGSGAEIVFFKRFFLSEFWLFGCGIMAYRLYTLLPPKARITDALLFVALIITICIADLTPEKAEPFTLPLVTILALPLVFRLFRQSRFDRLVGKICYPFYLLHFSAIALFEEVWDEPSGWHILAFTLVAAILVHSIFNPAIETLKHKMRTVGVPPLAGEAVTLSGTIVRR